MDSPRTGTARDLVYRALAKAGDDDMSGAQLTRSIVGTNRASIDQALAKGVRAGDVIKTGWGRYKLTADALAAFCVEHALPPPVVNSAAPAFAPALGTRCAVVLPENRSQGTIAQALRAVMSADAALSLDAIFQALPIGWARTEALSGLKEGALEGWANFGLDGWQLVGDPPETRAADPLAVAHIPNYTQHRLQEVSGDVRALLADAVVLGRSSALVRALANAHAEIDTALQMFQQPD